MLKKIQARSDEATTQDQLEEIARGVAGVAYGSKNTLPILFLFDYIFLSLAGTDTVNICFQSVVYEKLKTLRPS